MNNVKAVQPYDTLEDFVLQYLTPDTANTNRYFRPQHSFVCDSENRVLVDFIGRFESLHDDYETIRQKTGTGNPLKKLNVTQADIKPPEEYFANKEVLRKVITIYGEDFKLFGYSTAISEIQ